MSQSHCLQITVGLSLDVSEGGSLRQRTRFCGSISVPESLDVHGKGANYFMVTTSNISNEWLQQLQHVSYLIVTIVIPLLYVVPTCSHDHLPSWRVSTQKTRSQFSRLQLLMPYGFSPVGADAEAGKRLWLVVWNVFNFPKIILHQPYMAWKMVLPYLHLRILKFSLSGGLERFLFFHMYSG